MIASLTATDLDRHARLRIPADLLAAARVRRLTDSEARDVLGLNGKAGDFAGVEYPYIDPATSYRVTGRIRLDHPPVKPDGTPDKKYLAPYGDVRHLYFPPGAASLLTALDVPIALVESEKAALALTAAADRAGRRVLVLATGGCWSWRGRIGKTENAQGTTVDVKGPLPDLKRITWPSRRAIILFDANPNDSVLAARRELARVLRQWGADVLHAYLPGDDDQINGPDDLVAARGDAALWRVIDQARSEDFTRDTKDRIIATSLDNVRLALAKLGTAPRYDAFTREVLIGGVPADDVTLDKLWVQIDDTFHFRVSKETLRTLLVTEAHEAPFHPVRDYLNRLEWDGTPRLNTWLSTYAGADASPYVSAVGALPLIAAVRRARQPGAKFDELLILESGQGKLKSTALQMLCPSSSWFSDDLPLGVDSKQVIERTAGKWILEASELHGNRGKEAEQLKAYLSRQVDGPVRLAYAHLPVSVPRQFVIIGTTNASLSYLKDSTGGRRFWPVRVQQFDIDALREDRDQLWAEAAAREAAGESIRLDSDLWSHAGAAQEDRRAADPWEAILEPLFDLDQNGIATVEYVTGEQVWSTLKLEANHLDNRHADRVSAILQRHGLTKKTRVRIDGKQTRCWAREDVTL